MREKTHIIFVTNLYLTILKKILDELDYHDTICKIFCKATFKTYCLEISVALLPISTLENHQDSPLLKPLKKGTKKS